jgi:hypothetical protein
MLSSFSNFSFWPTEALYCHPDFENLSTKVELPAVRLEVVAAVDLINGVRDGSEAVVIAILTSRAVKIGSSSHLLPRR